MESRHFAIYVVVLALFYLLFPCGNFSSALSSLTCNSFMKIQHILVYFRSSCVCNSSVETASHLVHFHCNLLIYSTQIFTLIPVLLLTLKFNKSNYQFTMFLTLNSIAQFSTKTNGHGRHSSTFVIFVEYGCANFHRNNSTRLK